MCEAVRVKSVRTGEVRDDQGESKFVITLAPRLHAQRRLHHVPRIPSCQFKITTVELHAKVSKHGP